MEIRQQLDVAANGRVERYMLDAVLEEGGDLRTAGPRIAVHPPKVVLGVFGQNRRLVRVQVQLQETPRGCAPGTGKVELAAIVAESREPIEGQGETAEGVFRLDRMNDSPIVVPLVAYADLAASVG